MVTELRVVQFGLSDFVNHLYDYRLNWTPLSPVTITYSFLFENVYFFSFLFQKKWEALAPRAPPPSQALYKVPFYFLCAVYCDNLQQLNGQGIGRKLQRLKLSFYHCLKIKTLTGNILKYCSREEDFLGVIDKSCRVLTFLFWMDYSCV